MNSEVSKSAETYITGRSQLCKAGGEHSRQNASGTNESGVLGKREGGQFIQHTPADPTESCRDGGLEPSSPGSHTESSKHPLWPSRPEQPQSLSILWSSRQL